MVNIERSKLNQAMYQKLKKYIMNKRKKELEEMKQVAYYKRLKKEKEERKRQVEIDTENLEKVKQEICSTRDKLDDLKSKKKRLFQLFKEKANEENQLKEKHKREQAAQHALHGTQFPVPHTSTHPQLYISPAPTVPQQATQAPPPPPNAAAAISLLQAGTGGANRNFGGQSSNTPTGRNFAGQGGNGGPPVSQFQTVQQNPAAAAAAAHAAQKMIMVCGVQPPQQQGTKRARSPSPVPPSSGASGVSVGQTSYHHSGNPAYKVATVSLAGNPSGSNTYGNKLPVVYSQVGSGPQSLYLDRNAGQPVATSVVGAASGLPNIADADAQTLAAAAVAMAKYKYLPTGYTHPAAVTQNYARQPQAMMEAAMKTNPASNQSPATSSHYAKSHLPPAATSYRGSITTGQSAQQIQMQAQLHQQQMQLQQQFMAAVAQQQQVQAVAAAVQQQQQAQQVAAAVQQQQQAQQVAAAVQQQQQAQQVAAAVQQQQQAQQVAAAVQQQQQAQQAAAAQQSPKGQGGSAAYPGGQPGHLSGIQGYPNLSTSGYQVYSSQGNTYLGQQRRF